MGKSECIRTYVNHILSKNSVKIQIKYIPNTTIESPKEFQERGIIDDFMRFKSGRNEKRPTFSVQERVCEPIMQPQKPFNSVFKTKKDSILITATRNPSLV